MVRAPVHRKPGSEEPLRKHQEAVLLAAVMLGKDGRQFTIADVRGFFCAAGEQEFASMAKGALVNLVNRGKLRRIDVAIYALARNAVPTNAAAPKAPEGSSIKAPSKAQLMAGRAR